MKHKTQNPELIKSLTNKLDAILRKSSITKDGLNIYSKELLSFYEAMSKLLGEWISDDDIQEIIYVTFFDLYSSNLPTSDEKIFLSDFLDEESIKNLARIIIEKISILPRSYLFKFPVPSLTALKEPINFDDTIRFFPGKGIINTPLGLKLSTSKIHIEAEGYAHGSRHNSAAKNALAKLKVTCKIADLYGLFIYHRGGTPMSLDFGSIKTRRMFSVEIEESFNDPSSIGSFEVELGISNYLNDIHLGFAHDNELYIEQFNNIKLATSLIFNEKAEDNVRSIRRALEWLFDASVDEDPTTSFVKTCIGLEALLAEKSENIGITEQLADRCAFLLSKTVMERKKTKEIMKHIYQLRSKIVHGNISGITHKEKNTAVQARDFLRRALRVEITSVIEWWKKSQRRENRSS